MLSIRREGDKVIVKLEYDIPGFGQSFCFTDNCVCNAELSLQSLKRKIESTLKEIREEAYNNGWKDKSDKKHAKETWFSGSF